MLVRSLGLDSGGFAFVCICRVFRLRVAGKSDSCLQDYDFASPRFIASVFVMLAKDDLNPGRFVIFRIWLIRSGSAHC
jgi:hypothetical protein